MKERRPAKQADHPTTPVIPAAEGITRRELALLVSIVAAGIVLRLIGLASSGVEHFDEGVYASNVYCQDLGGTYPDQRFYAPPLLPALIEAGMIAGLPPSLAALLPGFLAGCGTIIALWWIGRSWFGPASGLAAATLAALSDFHIAYSAAALTDVLLGLWLVLAIDAIARSLGREDFRWAVVAGIYTGLAWWTKYNGWLPLAIQAAALPLVWLVTQRSLLRPFGCFAVTAITAFVVWSPNYLSLQASGGYGPIAANHARFLVGLAGWLDSAGRQISAQYAIQGPLSAAALGVALVVVRRFLGTSTGWRPGTLWRDFSAVLAGLIFGLMLTSFVVAGIAAAIGITTSLIRLLRACRHEVDDRRQAVATCLLAVWWVGLLIATPCYSPYPRLVLPWLLASWLGTALCWQQAERASEGWHANSPQWLGCLVFAVLVAGMCLIGSQMPESLEAIPSADRRGLERIAAAIHRLEPSGRRAIYVYGEPSLFFQLCAAGETMVVPAKNIPPSATYFGKPFPTFLAIGPHARRDPEFQRQWAQEHEQWLLVEAYDYQPSPIVWLDLRDPRRPDSSDAAALNRVEVYRRK